MQDGMLMVRISMCAVFRKYTVFTDDDKVVL